MHRCEGLRGTPRSLKGTPPPPDSTVTASFREVHCNREVGSSSPSRPIELAGIHLVTPGPHTRWVSPCCSTLS